MKKYLLLLAVSGLFLTSCKKCKDCEYKVEWKITDGFTSDELAVLDASYMAMYGMTYENYFQSLYAPVNSSAEYCGDDLEAIEATADVNVAGYYRYYWDCK